jgi:hypothetical protein
MPRFYAERDTAVTAPLHHKYAHLARVVANLESAQVSQMFRASKDPLAFFPSSGLYAYEFALGYVLNKAGRRGPQVRKPMEPPARQLA